MFMAMKPSLRVVAGQNVAVGSGLVFRTSLAEARISGNVLAQVSVRGGGGGKGEDVNHLGSGYTYFGEGGKTGGVSTVDSTSLYDSPLTAGERGTNRTGVNTTNNVGAVAEDGIPGGVSSYLSYAGAGGVGGRGGRSGAWGESGSDWDRWVYSVSNIIPTVAGRGGGAVQGSIPIQIYSPEAGGVFIIVKGF